MVDQKTPEKPIFLIGFSGSGKSTIGSLLARSMETEFVDTDSIIEKRECRSINEIFRVKGEKFFRDLERDVITSLVNGRKRGAVIAVGGGAFSNRILRNRIKKVGLVIYLSCAVREIHRRLSDKTDRPLMNVKPTAGETPRKARLKHIHNLLNKRLLHYRQADITFATTDKIPTQVVNEMLEVLRETYGYH